MSELIDNGAARVETLKQVIRGLHDGEALDVVQRRMLTLVRQCDASDVAAMEQQLIAEGMPACEITKACDLHSQAVRQVLVTAAPVDLPAGHPVDTFRRENDAIRAQLDVVRGALGALAEGPADRVPEATLVEAARHQLGLLMDVHKHYERKENLLFPFLEKRGITGPSTVMWAKDDEVRKLLGELGDVLAGECTAMDWGLIAGALGERAFRAVEEMVFKEDNILLPMALQKLEDTEWAQIEAQSPQFGYCLVDPAGTWAPSGVEAGPSASAAGAVMFPTGSLSLAQLQGLFSALPVDVTFVDADDRVRFFSEGPSRVFHRAKAVIGRKVQNCHPPASVGTVERILADFRAGTQDVAEFWIEMRGRFVHIRYFAVRDAARAYLGTLEVTQDLTRERALQGERRLLEYS